MIIVFVTLNTYVQGHSKLSKVKIEEQLVKYKVHKDAYIGSVTMATFWRLFMRQDIFW